MTRFPDQIDGTGWEYGTPDRLPARAGRRTGATSTTGAPQEARLNELDHFRTRIDGQSIHFVHARSPHADALPLLIMHGWPGSVVEFLDVIPRLTDPERHGGDADDAFHVVAPSLPGYGFSEPPRTPGWDVRRIARAFVELMDRLGYDALRRAGRRLGRAGRDQDRRRSTRSTARRCTSTCRSPRRPPEPVPLTEEEQADLAAMARVPARGGGLRAAAGDEAADAGHGAQRLAGRPAVVDRREVPHLERLRRRPRELLHPRPADHQRDALLGDADDRVVGPAVLGDHAQRRAAGATGVRRPFPPASRATPRKRCCASRARGSSSATT